MLILKPKKPSRESELTFAVYDIEAKPRYENEPLNTLYLGAGTFDGSRYLLHKNQADLVRYMLTQDNTVWYAHNASGYDLSFVMETLIDLGIPFQAFKTGSRIFLESGSVKFFDSQVFLNGSLESVANSLRTKSRKLTQPNDPDFFTQIHKRDWQPYLEADCRTLFECISAIRQAIQDLGVDLRATVASTAMELWRTNYLDQEISIPRYYHPSETASRSAYVGGRCEIFKRQIGNGASWDINSSYPHKMLQPMPAQYTRTIRGTDLEPFSIVEATVEIPSDCYAPPIHSLSTIPGKLVFPIGRLHGWYTSDELTYCREKFGMKSVTVYQSHLYDPLVLFRTYVLDLYERRKQAKATNDFAMAEACKLLMNSLYGKFGQNRQRSKLVHGPEWRDFPFDNPTALAKIQRLRKHLANHDRLEVKSVYNEDKHLYGIPDFVEFGQTIQPAIAAWITAQGRLHLQRLIDEAGKNIAYCDTDSVYLATDNPSAHFKSEIGDGLGQLKLEQTFTHAEFIAPKCYEVTTNQGPKTKAKGVPKSANQAAFLRGEPVKLKRMRGIFEQLARNGEVHPQSAHQVKRAKLTNPKRNLDADKPLTHSPTYDNA